MNVMKFHTVLAIGFVFMALAACKKKGKEETPLKNSLSGTMTFSMPAYVGKNIPIALTPVGVKHPTGALGYYWTVSWSTKRDTTKLEKGTGDGTFAFRTPRTVGTYTVSCIAFAEGYYTSSGIRTFSVVDATPDSTLTDLGINRVSDPKFTDPRDGRTYYTATVGGKVWTRTNLGYAGSGISYEGCTVMDPLFGRLYTWKEAVKACPAGWHLPSDADWAALGSALSGASFAAGDVLKGVSGSLMTNARFMDKRMWEFWPKVKITNKSGLGVIPVGYASDRGDSYRYVGLNDYAAFWTADTKETNGVYRYVYVSNPDVLVGYGDQESFLASVRCVKD